MKPFCELNARDLNAGILQSEIGARGYILVRNVLPRDEVNKVLGSVAQVVAAAGWLLPDNEPSQRMANVEAACGDPDPMFKKTYQEVFNLAGFHALPHRPELKRVMTMLVGNRLLVHPKPIGRLIFPNCEKLTVHAHQDYRFMGGDPECFTAWIPLHDCPIDAGPLQIMEGSHQFGFQNHEDENLHVPEIPAGSAVGGEWVGGEIRAGDVLIFHSLTVHAAAQNRSKQLRISIDCRFQDYSRVINPSNLAFAGESGKSWEKVYSSWPCDDLKFYWKDLPLNLKPSIAELTELSINADSPAMRSRYARILSQVN